MDPSPVLKIVGLADAPVPEASADDPTPTAIADAPEDGESPSIDEAFAALDEAGAPQETAAVTEDEDAASDIPPGFTAEQYAEYEALKAEKELLKAQEAEAAFYAPWARQEEINNAFFDAEVDRIWAIGREQGRTEAEIKAVIYDRVELGQGFGIQRINPQTGQVETIGRIQTERELEANLRRAMVFEQQRRSQPSALDTLSSKYGLDEADRQTVAQLVNTLPAEQLESVARALGAKNQRVVHQQTAVKQAAAKTVAANLSNGIAPGTGSAPTRKPYQYTHDPAMRERETELFARKIGLLRG